MPEDIGYLIIFFLLVMGLPITSEAVVLLRLWYGKDRRRLIGYLGLAANFFSMAILASTFLYNRFSNGAIGSDLSVEVSFVLAFCSIILGCMAPRRTRWLIVGTGVYLCVLWLMVAAGSGVL